MNKKKIVALLAFVMAVGAIGAYGILTQPVEGEYYAKFVSGTEYQAGEVGQTVVRLHDSRGVGVASDYCNVSIWYPDKTVWEENTTMLSGGADGSWYLEWTTPNVIGVYEEYAECVLGAKTYGVSSSFHVSQTLTALNESLSTPEEPSLSIVS